MVQNMNRYEFIEKLRAALSGRVTQSVLNENIRFYEEYLDTEIRKGRSEEEVLGEIGDPRLLAKTITEASKQAAGSVYEEEIIEDGESSQSNSHTRTRVKVNGKNFRLPTWVLLLVTVLVILFVITIICTLLSVLIPILVPLFLLIMAAQIVMILLRRR